MIRINRILVNCENQLTVENHAELERMRAKLAGELKLEPSQITLTYEEPTENETN
jgi:hypothetical protein